MSVDRYPVPPSGSCQVNLVPAMKLLGVRSLDELEPGHVTQLQRLVPRG